jgi:hypothetical protein
MTKDPREDSSDETARTSPADRTSPDSLEAESVSGGAVSRIESREVGRRVDGEQSGTEIVPFGEHRGPGLSQAHLYASIKRRNMFIAALIVVVMLLVGIVLWQQSTVVTTASARTSASVPTTAVEAPTITSSPRSPSGTRATSASATASSPSSLTNSTTAVASARWGPVPFKIGFQGVVLDAIPPFAPDAGSNSSADIWTIDGGSLSSGVGMARWDRTYVPDARACAQAIAEGSTGGLTVRAGMSVCLSTMEDRYALITVNSTNPSGRSVDVTLTVWNSE